MPCTTEFLTVLAALGGAVINMLMALRDGSHLLDTLIVGMVSVFAGMVLSPVLVAPLTELMPRLAEAGQVPVAGAVALLGAHYLLRWLEALAGGDDL